MTQQYGSDYGLPGGGQPSAQPGAHQPVQQIILPKPPNPTAEIEREADLAIGFLNRLTSASNLDPELRMSLNDIKNTVKNLKLTVTQQRAAAQAAHDRTVEILKSNRLL